MKFSIVIPSYNQAAYLERTLCSVFLQADLPLTYPRAGDSEWQNEKSRRAARIDPRQLEIVAVEGGSVDASPEIIAKYSRLFPQTLRCVEFPGSRQAEAINRGMEQARGDVLAFLNSDDVYYPGALAEILDAFRSAPEAQVIYGAADYIDETDRLIAPFPTETWSYERLRETCFICQPACFWRKDVSARRGLLDPSLDYCLDYEYWLRIGKDSPFRYVPTKLAGARCHSAAKTFSKRLEAHEEVFSMLKRMHGSVRPRWARALSKVRAEQALSATGNRFLQRAHYSSLYWWNLARLLPSAERIHLADLLRWLGPPFASSLKAATPPFAAPRITCTAQEHP
jgi:glycosyltransferase involved in cell wall biosynthesis